MQIGVMVEGQEGLSWERWRRIALAADALGFDSLWRSDHFFSLFGDRTQDALETFVSLALAAEWTSRVRLGPLVSSVTFRHPALLARMAAQIDQLSGGRFVLGVGAGWNVPEHEAFGLDFPLPAERLDRLSEAIAVCRALWGEGPASYEGTHYRLHEAEAYPKPVQQPLPILVGGSGERRTLRIVAEQADEWNAAYLTVQAFEGKRAVLAQHCEAVGRDVGEIKCSLMLGYAVGRDEAEVRAHLARIPGQRADADLEALRGRGWLIGSPAELVAQLGRYEEAGLSGVMLHHLAQEAHDALELIAAEVLPQVQR